ncbi:hypothetical protein N0V82_008508 [Gnomoniopsis sp. IMI 355080]|nr:hypothetical protein N0V82_008508 [Gnomoniopsis sp. IMI 355080]
MRCGKSFKDHETMLIHLARCEHLATREYWCYDHMRIERFDDMKCKRCISHPSRRRRMLTVAKTFFNTLGKKARKPTDLTSTVEDTMPAPPSYHESEFLNLDLPEKPELSSTTEILEIDSTEVTASDPPVPAIDPQELLLPELDCLPMQSSMQWQPTPIGSNASYDFSLAAPAYESLSSARLTSQVPSPGPSQAQPVPRSFPPSARSKNLSPSSSVRSTTSTMSNVSAISTSSSMWSAPSTAWSGMETNFTSPSIDLISPLDYNSSNFLDNVFEDCPSGPLDMISELPADMPDLHELSSGDFGMQDSLFAFDADLPSTVSSYSADLAVGEVSKGDETQESAAVQALEGEIQSNLESDAKYLAAAAWDALSEHILSSHAKIKHIRNPLANQLGMLSPQTVMQKGLHSLRSILGGRPLTSPLDTLCLVHITYSFSLATCEDDATRRSSQLFKQALLYSVWFTLEDKVHFREVAAAIWQPSGMTDAQFDQLINEPSRNLCQSPSNNGKGRATTSGHSTTSNVDPLISIAETFLDELERTAVLGSSFEAHASEIRALHKKNDMMSKRPGSPSTANSGRLMNVLNVLVNQFHEVDGLIARLSEVNQYITNGLLRSTRRFELEALQAGQHCIVTSKYHDSYAPLVRSLCDPIYELDGNSGLLRRQDFHALGISLSEALIMELQTEPIDFDAVSTLGSDNDAALEFLSPPPTDNLMNMESELQPLLGLGIEDLDIQPASTKRPMRHSDSTTKTATAATTNLNRSKGHASTSQSDIQTPSSSSASPNLPEKEQHTQQQKLEADACCEICGYRPKGDPRWFHGSMAKHRKLQHSTDPPKIYKCKYPGCSSAFKNRPDNLRQHQIEKGHFVDGEEGPSKRPSKRKKVS